MFVKESPLKGSISLFVGITLSLTGYDEFNMTGRWTFGITSISDGVTLLPFLVGLFAFSELLKKTVDALRDSISNFDRVVGSFNLVHRIPFFGQLY